MWTALAALAALVVFANAVWLSAYPFRIFRDAGRLSWLSTLQGRSWDWTEEGLNSLRPETRKLLDILQEPAEIWSFFSADESYNGVPLAEDMAELLRRMADYNGAVRANIIDSLRDTDRAYAEARKLELNPAMLPTVMVIAHGGRRIAIPAGRLMTPPDAYARMAGVTNWTFEGEVIVAANLRSLIDPRRPRVYFTTGHLELDPSANAAADRSSFLFMRELALLHNMDVRTLAFRPGFAVPEDCETLVVAGPRNAPDPEMTAAVRTYMERGGRLLYLPASIEKIATLEDQNGFEEWDRQLYEWGGMPRWDSLADVLNNYNGQAELPRAVEKGDTEQTQQYVMPGARSIQENTAARRQGWQLQRLLESHPTAEARTLPTTAEAWAAPRARGRPGVYPLAFRAWWDTDAGKESRLVVAGSSEMASSMWFERAANRTFLTWSMNWLTGRNEYAETPEPKEWIDRRLKLSEMESRAAAWLGLVALPLAWVLAGAFVWWARKD